MIARKDPIATGSAHSNLEEGAQTPRDPRQVLHALRVRVPAAAIFEARQILESMRNIQKVTPLHEMEGWLRMEPITLASGNPPTAYQVNNKILSALIRAKIPILGFEVEDGRHRMPSYV